MHRYHPGPRHGRGAAGRQRTPRHADGARPRGLAAVDPAPAARSPPPRLARPRPFRAVLRACLDAAVQPAAPDRLRPPARRDQALPAVGLQDAGASRARPHRGGRDHHRTTGPGPGQRRRHGDRGAPAGAALQPSRPRADQAPDLGVRQRRRSDGGALPRSLLARGAPATGSPQGALRRQRHLHRRAYRADLHRRRRRPLRGVRLAGVAGGRRQRPRGDRPRVRGSGGGNRATHPDRAAHHHRLSGSHPAEHRQGAR